MIQVFMTDFGSIKLAPSFVRAADRKWSDKRCTKNPRWVGKVFKAIETMAFYDFAGIRKAPSCLKSLAQLEPYLRVTNGNA